MKKKNVKSIQVPDGLISNQLREDNIKISPKTTYLYVWLKILLTDYKTNTLTITPKELRENLKWKSKAILKNHLKTLKDLGYITYQDEFDNGNLQAHQPLMITILSVKENFKKIRENVLLEKVMVSSSPEKAIRFCYLIRCYTNQEYGYCWLTYTQIREYGQIRREDIEELIFELSRLKVIEVERGTFKYDSQNRYRKENNKYFLLI